MKSALLSAFLRGDTIFLRANVGTEQVDWLRLPDNRGISTVPASNTQALGRELNRAARWLSDVDKSGHVHDEDQLVSWEQLTGQTEAEFWRNAKQALVGFSKDGVIDIAASRHGDDVGVYLWQKPYFSLKSPSDMDLGIAVIDALSQST